MWDFLTRGFTSRRSFPPWNFGGSETKGVRVSIIDAHLSPATDSFGMNTGLSTGTSPMTVIGPSCVKTLFKPNSACTGRLLKIKNFKKFVPLRLSVNGSNPIYRASWGPPYRKREGTPTAGFCRPSLRGPRRRLIRGKLP